MALKGLTARLQTCYIPQTIGNRSEMQFCEKS